MAQLSDEKKEKLRKLLGLLANDEEKQELQKLDAQKVKDIIKFFEEQEAQTEDKLEKLMISFNKYAAVTQRHSQSLADMFGELTETLTKKLGELGGTITTSYEKNKPFNAAPVYKDIINQLSAVNENTRTSAKARPVWNWPQYAGVSVRNRNFSNINPATDHLDLSSYDYVALVQASLTDTYTFKTGGVSGTTTATVIVTFTDSTKATISTVVKTPVTVL